MQNNRDANDKSCTTSSSNARAVEQSTPSDSITAKFDEGRGYYMRNALDASVPVHLNSYTHRHSGIFQQYNVDKNASEHRGFSLFYWQLTRQLADPGLYSSYKQNKGRMKSKGNRNGTTTRERPQVHNEPMHAAQMVANTVADSIKQPPLTLPAT